MWGGGGPSGRWVQDRGRISTDYTIDSVSSSPEFEISKE
jgi:hypothetical protein